MYDYFTAYPRDPLWLKSFVMSIWYVYVRIGNVRNQLSEPFSRVLLTLHAVFCVLATLVAEATAHLTVDSSPSLSRHMALPGQYKPNCPAATIDISVYR